jgi:integrase
LKYCILSKHLLSSDNRHYVIFIEFMALILLCFREIWEKIAEIYLWSALRVIGKSINRNNFPLLRAVSVFEFPPAVLAPRFEGGEGSGADSVRHSYASLILLAGEPLAYVSAQLGHKSPEITLRVYSHWIPGTKRAARHALDNRSAENINGN